MAKSKKTCGWVVRKPANVNVVAKLLEVIEDWNPGCDVEYSRLISVLKEHGIITSK